MASWRWKLLLLVALQSLSTAHAQTVTFNGSIGQRAALLVIDGRPRTVALGATVDGVTLVSLADGAAQVDVGGRRSTLAIGTPVSLGGSATAGGRQIVLAAGPGGHFVANGSINGRVVSFLVDTGATAVSIGMADASRIGLDLRNAAPIQGYTANGRVVARRITLSSVRIGDVEVTNVEAVVLPGAMEHVLLGNSFLTRFSMRRDADILRLEMR